MQEIYSTNMRILISICTCLFILLGLCVGLHTTSVHVCVHRVTSGCTSILLIEGIASVRLGGQIPPDAGLITQTSAPKTHWFTGVGYDLVRCKVSNLSLLGPSHSIRMHYFIKRGPIPPLTSPKKKKTHQKTKLIRLHIELHFLIQSVVIQEENNLQIIQRALRRRRYF